MVVTPQREGILGFLRGVRRVVAAPAKTAGGVFNDWLKPELDNLLEGTERLWKDPVTYIRGRSFGSECERAITFDSLGHSVPFGAKKLRIFRTGRAIEKEIIDNMRQSPAFDSADVKLTYTDPPVNGRADVFMRRKSDGKILCGEIKSIGQNGWKRLPLEHGPTRAGDSPLMQTNRSYVMQLNTYLGSDDSPTDEGFLLFENKNDSAQRVYHIMFDARLRDGALAVSRSAARYLETQTLAPVPKERDPRGEDKTCANCDHRYLCSVLAPEAVDYETMRQVDAEIRG